MFEVQEALESQKQEFARKVGPKDPMADQLRMTVRSTAGTGSIKVTQGEATASAAGYEELLPYEPI